MTETNGIAGIKKIKFDFEFTYAKDGDEDIGDTIVVKEPSFDDLETHARMTSLVTKGLFGAMPVMKGMIDASEEPNNEGAKEAVEDQQQRSAMFIMALGMDDKKYIEFIRFVKNLLTNDNRYAYVDGEQIGISDLLWKNIEEQGGKAAVEQILAEFVGFFIEAMDGKKAA
jgi:ABC-type dipeptide/oligopeptide/nickel transport system permease component